MIESWFARPVNAETQDGDVPEGDCATGSSDLSKSTIRLVLPDPGAPDLGGHVVAG